MSSTPERGLDCEHGVEAAAYALRALEDAEARAFGEHLATCPICRAEVAQLRGVADALAIGVPRIEAPPGLGTRIVSTVYAEAEPLARGARQEESAKLARPARRGLVPGRRGLVPARRGLLPALAATLALAAGLLIGAFAINTGSSQHTEVIRALVIAPGSHASADLRKVGGRLQLVLAGMPAPPPGRIYEVWLEHGARAPEPTDVLFSVTRAGAGTVAVPSNLRGISNVLVTDEPLGGSLKPTRKPIIDAKI